MMWSRTSTMNKGNLSGVTDELAEYAAPGFQDIGKTRGKFAERTGGRQQSVEPRMRAELDRRFQSLAMRERGPARGRHLADLARNDFQAAAVERAAERHRDGPHSIPAQLDDGRLVGGDVERRGEPLGRGAAMKNKIAVGGRSRGRGEPQTQRPRQRLARRIDVDDRHLG